MTNLENNMERLKRSIEGQGYLKKRSKQKNSFMRIDKELLQELKKCKVAKKESYAEVVKRLIEKERRIR